MQGSQDILSCPMDKRLSGIQEWCFVAGHWNVKAHSLSRRTLMESVLIYCVNGKGSFTLGKVRRDVSAGDIFYCPPGVEHGYECSSTGWEIWWLHFGGTAASSLCRLARLPEKPIIHVGHNLDILDRFMELIAGLSSKTATAALDASGTLHALLIEILRVRWKNSNEFLYESIIENKIKNLDEMAREAGFSKYHFCRKFKKEMGKTPWSYLNEQKIRRAKELLLGSNLSIKEIANTLGFKNPDYFSKVFVKTSGVKPSAYRGIIKIHQ